MVGVAGFEPATPASRTRCSTRLSHTPTLRARLIGEASHRGKRAKGPVASPETVGYIGASAEGGRPRRALSLLGDGVMVTLRFLVPSF